MRKATSAIEFASSSWSRYIVLRNLLKETQQTLGQSTVIRVKMYFYILGSGCTENRNGKYSLSTLYTVYDSYVWPRLLVNCGGSKFGLLCMQRPATFLHVQILTVSLSKPVQARSCHHHQNNDGQFFGLESAYLFSLILRYKISRQQTRSRSNEPLKHEPSSCLLRRILKRHRPVADKHSSSCLPN